MHDPNWNQIRTFIHVVKLGNMSAAARELHLAQPTVGRQIASLETDLGVALFDRVGKEIHPTPLARQLAERFSAMQDSVDDAVSLARTQNEGLEGEVTITVTDVVSLHIMPKAIAELAKRAPDLRVNVHSENNIQDIARREADIAVRNTPSSHENLITRKLGQSRAYLYAHRDYLRENDEPTTIDDLRAHRLFAYDDIEKMVGQLTALGLHLPIAAFRAASNDGNLVHRLVENGEGIGLLPDFLGDPDTQLQRVLSDQIVIPFDTWITTRPELRTNPRIRLAFDIVADVVKAAIKIPDGSSQ